ncbi:MAG: hypothetical protein B7733_09435 [Myxococcales bacterium FL481]|nr:MAG: hypothetical protein B7733_09435 [Myxococcales bacterium FL481]
MNGNNLAPPSEVAKVWTSMGLQPQLFPQYYSAGPQSFTNANGEPSGEAGSSCTLTRDLSNFPHMFMGLRITNTYQLPNEPTAEDIALFRALKEHVDGEQTVSIDLAQQNITAQATLQVQMTGAQGITWAPFPAPFPMAGANNITVTLRRVTSYPLLGGQPVLPVARMTILAAVLRADLKTSSVHRVHPGV